jgi:peptidoglycan/LPS O-acetylase OafA/YrhL
MLAALWPRHEAIGQPAPSLEQARDKYRMKREVSVYLDLFRIVAAFAVLGEHSTDYVGGWIWHFGAYGAEAVGAFFVLSGFVIAFVSGRREQTAASYTEARALRMYSVVLPIMAITWLVGIIGPHFDPAAFNLGVNFKNDWFDYLRCLTFMHQIWNTDTHFGVNGPFWSLGFEVPYYILFGVAVFVRSPVYRNIALCTLLAFFGPRIVIYFPLWLIGVACYHVVTRVQKVDADEDRRSGFLWLVFWVTTFGGILLLHRLGHAANDYLKIYRKFQWSAVYFQTVAYFYGLGLLLAANIGAFAMLPIKWSGLINRFESPIRWLAGATFTLYLANLPTLLFVKAILPPFQNRDLRLTVVLVITIVFCLFLAEVIERRKGILGRLYLHHRR